MVSVMSRSLSFPVALAASLVLACGGAAPERAPSAPSAPRGSDTASARAPVGLEGENDDPDAPPLPEGAPDREVARLEAAGHSLRWNFVPRGRSERYGHAEVLVDAPQARVRKELQAFNHFRDLIPRKFKNARIVAKAPDGIDVYMQVPALKGLVTMWQVMRFHPVVARGDREEVIEGTFVKGNVKTAHFVLTTRRVTESRTLLKVDMLIVPGFAAPQGALDEGLRDAARDAADAFHDRAMADSAPLPPAAPAEGASAAAPR